MAADKDSHLKAPAVAPRVGDLVEVPELRTVIRLHDVDEESQAKGIASDFVFTEDAGSPTALLRPGPPWKGRLIALPSQPCSET